MASEEAGQRLRLAHEKEVPEGKGIVVSLPNGDQIALFKISGKIFALDNSCPHQGGPLGEGTLGDYTVTCPWHAWQFDVRTGECQNMPGDDAKTIQITIDHGEIFLI